jgi:hypothetical protein
LKNDETVESGESLTFNSHLVDIGSLEGENKPQPHVNVDIKQKNVSRFRTPGINSLTISSKFIHTHTHDIRMIYICVRIMLCLDKQLILQLIPEMLIILVSAYE